MFRQLTTPLPGTPNPAEQVIKNIKSLFTYHPLQISAMVETFWLNRGNAANSSTSAPFLPWAPELCNQLLTANFFPGYSWSSAGKTPLSPLWTVPPLDQPGIFNTWDGNPGDPNNAHPTNWDHLIYAYVVENTRIVEIFSKVLETYMFSEQLEAPSPESQLFWRNVEFLIYGDAMPSMLWTTTSRLRSDEVANRLTAYYWMFGLDLSHAAEIAGKHPYQKPAASNRDFIPTFEAFGREVWRGIMNARNTSGANDTDPTVIATLARRIYDMMATRRMSGNLVREEFRAVSITSFLNLAILFDSPAVIDLKATASSPEMRLQKIAERVGMTAHSRTKPFFDLAGPFSILMQSIEAGKFNDTVGAQLLYSQIPPNFPARNAETVIDQYSLATGHDLKSQPVSIIPRMATSTSSGPRRQSPPPGSRAPNGHAPNGHGGALARP